MSIRSRLEKLRKRTDDKAPATSSEPAAKLPEEQRFSSVDIAGHSAAKEAERLSDNR
jgi:hypothetical protein